MSEIRIIHQQIQQSLDTSAIQLKTAEQFIDNLRVGQILNAQLVKLDNKFWLLIENIKLFIPKETVELLGLRENQSIRIKVRTIADPVELQIVKTKLKNTEQLKTLTNNTSEKIIKQSPINTLKKSSITKNIDADKLILEARKFLNKTITATQSQVTQTSLKVPINTDSDNIKPRQLAKSGEITLQTKSIKTASEQPALLPLPNRSSANNKSIETLSHLISQSRVIATETIPDLQQKSLAAKTVSKIEQTGVLHKSKVKPEQVIKNSFKSGQGTVKTEQLFIKPANVKANVMANVTSKDSQVNVKSSSQSVNHADKVVPKAQLIHQDYSNNRINSNSKTTKPPLETMKLDIAVNLPDKDKFPLLSEKIDLAYRRLLPAQNFSSRSITNLFDQLQRLNQWTSDNNKSTRSSSSPSKPEKLAADLKESLRDLFRYINQKDKIKTGKSIEKALHQSGTFLEKRTRLVQESTRQHNSKTSAGLTIHKDLKANLHRVLATALYNLAKIKATGTSTTSGNNPVGIAKSTTQTNTPGLARQLSGNSTTSENNLIQSIRNRLISFKSTTTKADYMPELERITKEVLKNVQSALIRSQLGQLTNLRPESAPQQWTFELPVMNNKDVDMFFIQFKEHEVPDDDEKSKQGWSLILQFDISPLGKIRALLNWIGNKVNIRFLAEQKNTVDLMSNELEHFQSVLSVQGLSFEELSVEQTLLDDMNIRFSRSENRG